jgi:hypothetical protein
MKNLASREVKMPIAKKVFHGFDRSLWDDIVTEEEETGAQFHERCIIRVKELRRKERMESGN